MFLNSYSILFGKQFAFRHSHSTTHALIEITEKIKQACDSRQYACGVFLHLQNAFDNIMIYFSGTSTIMVLGT